MSDMLDRIIKDANKEVNRLDLEINQAYERIKALADTHDIDAIIHQIRYIEQLHGQSKAMRNVSVSCDEWKQRYSKDGAE